MQVPIDEAGFVILPASLQVAFACLVVLLITRNTGKRLRASGNNLQGMILDIINLLMASSLIAALSGLPLIASLSSRVSDWIIESTGSGGLNIGAGIVLGIGLVAIGIWYAKSEKFYPLIIFGIVALVAASLSSVVNDALSWWTNNPVRWFWNLLVDVFTSVLGYTI